MLKSRNYIGDSKWDLDTPCLVVDEEILEQNIQTMQTYLSSLGKQLRPHAKTHKCSRIAQKQIEAGCRGICVAKMSEAEVCTVTMSLSQLAAQQGGSKPSASTGTMKLSS